MSMKKSNDTFGNRTRELSVCGSVPQFSALPYSDMRLLEYDFDSAF